MKKNSDFVECEVFNEDVDKLLLRLYNRLDYYFKVKNSGEIESCTGYYSFGSLIPTIFRLATRFWCNKPMKRVKFKVKKKVVVSSDFVVSIDEIPF